MTIEFGMFRYGIRFSEPSYVLRVTVDGVDTDNLDFPATGTLDPNTDYFFSGDGGSTDLVQMLEDTLATHASSGYSTVAVALDASTHELEVTADATFLLEWTHANTTLDATIFGWLNSADSDEDETITSPFVPQGLVFLGRPVSDDSRPRQGVIGGLTRNILGDVEGCSLDDPYPDRFLEVTKLHRSIALEEYAPSTAPYATIESMHLRALARGYRIHYVPDASSPLSYVVLKHVPPLQDRLERDTSTQSRLLWKWACDFVQLDSVGGGGAGGGAVPGGAAASSGAPTDASYVVMSLDSRLSAERRLQVGTGLSLTDGGANGDVTLAATSALGQFTPSGMRRGFGWWLPGITATPTHHGLHRVNLSGTNTHPDPATTNLAASLRRWRLFNGTGAGTGNVNMVSWTSASAEGRCFWRGDAAGFGGFFLAFLGFSLTLDANTRFMFGLLGGTSNGPGSTSDPSTLTNMFALAADDTDANLQIMHNDGSGTATKIDLGIAKDTISSRVYDLFFYAAPNASSISYRLIRVDAAGDTGAQAVSTDLPAATSFMGAMTHVHYPGGSVAATGFLARALYGEWNIGYGVEGYGYF